MSVIIHAKSSAFNVKAIRGVVTVCGAVLPVGADPALAMQAASTATATGSTGAAPASSNGRISAPPANSAMRRAGGGTIAAQASTAGTQGTATPTNAMTLNSGSDRGMQGDQRSTNRQGTSGPGGTQSTMSIDSSGLTQRRNGGETPR